MKKVIVNGANGRLGRVAVAALEQHSEFELVAKNTRADDLATTIEQTGADIVVELTNATAVFDNSRTIIEQGVHPVIGASGLSLQQIDALQTLSENKGLGGLIAPNFSIGAILMMRFASLAANYFPHVEIIETHHEKKLDAPSATALKTAEMIAENRLVPPMEHQDPNNPAHGLSHQSVNIHSLRLPGFIAKQQVIFGSQGESLTIESNCIGREAFSQGILLACSRVSELSKLVYGLDGIV